MTEPLDLDAIRHRSLAYRDASGPLDGAAARTAADSAADVPALLAEVERLAGELAKAQWHQERCHAHHIASDAELAELRRTSQQSIDARDRLLREATAERDTLRAVAQGNKRHVAYLAAAREWWNTEELPAHLLDDQERALRRAVAALDRVITTPTQPTGIPHSAAEPPAHLTPTSGTNPPRSQRYGQTRTAHGASETNS